MITPKRQKDELRKLFYQCDRVMNLVKGLRLQESEIPEWLLRVEHYCCDIVIKIPLSEIKNGNHDRTA